MTSAKARVEEKILSLEKLSVFTIADFLSLGSYDTVKKTIYRLEAEGKVKRAIDGIFYIPSYSAILKEELYAPIEKVSMAITRKNKWEICPYGDSCLNMFGLDTQVPAKRIYVSDGPTCTYKIYKSEIVFLHENPRNIKGLSMKSRMVIQALKALGKERVNDKTIRILRKELSQEEKNALLRECQNVTAWIYDCIKSIAEFNITDDARKFMLERIAALSANYIVTVNDFVDKTSYNVAKSQLARIEKEGLIKRINDGLYCTDVESFSSLSSDIIASSIANKFTWEIAPYEQTAMYLLGLSEEEPKEIAFASDGPTRKYVINDKTINFYHTSQRNLKNLSYKSALVVQSLKGIGKGNLTDTQIIQIRSSLTVEELLKLREESDYCISWIKNYINVITTTLEN